MNNPNHYTLYPRKLKNKVLIDILENEYSQTFDDDYIIPVDSGLNEEIIIRTLQGIIGKPWAKIKLEIIRW